MPHHDLSLRLLVALVQSNDLAVASVLSRDVHLVVDSGDEHGGELQGRAAVHGRLRRGLAAVPGASLQPVHVNGSPGLALLRPDGVVIGVMAIEGDSTIDALFLSTAPAKLARWNRRRPEID